MPPVNPNQFAQGVTKGQVDFKHPGQSISVEVDASQSTPLVPGQCVKMVDSAGGVPKVIACAADTDDVLGVVPYDMRLATFKAGQQFEMLLGGATAYMEASAPTARGAKVMQVITGSKVALATTGKVVIGRAIDKAVSTGDLIRVRFTLPGPLAP